MKIGTDIVEINRFIDKLEDSKFMNRVYTEKEQAYIHQKGASRFSTAAGLFCAKEAVIKAIGTGFIGQIRLTDIEIKYDALGAPDAMVSGRPAGAFAVSISHAKEYATATALFFEDRKWRFK